MKKFEIDFLGIGIEKAATYWVADCLREHPEVCFAKQKEVAFFNEFDQHFLKHNNPRYERGIDWYASFFKKCDGNKKQGEYTPTYLYSLEAAKRIKKHFPKVKLICTLRNPVKRAFSQYLHDKSIGILDVMSFEQAIKKHPNYIEKGYYAKYLKHWFKHFKKSQILILFTDDIKNNPQKEISKVYKFLKLKNNRFTPKSLNKKPNPASTARFPWLNKLLMNSEYKIMNKRFAFLHKILEDLGIRKAVFWASYYINRKPIKEDNYPKINTKTEKYLKKKYKKDILELEKLLKRDLKNWF